MHILIYIAIICATGVLLFMLYNRLYYEIHLAHGLKKLRKALQESMDEQVDLFTRELKDTLTLIINEFIDAYQDMINEGKEEE